ncbi:UDP-N-acetylglucosamine acyltransferase [Candidatus Liberibacter solanacearum]|uniref:Acyl-[acyl-carrier-protein]--UDP-N-acetylglucosamine O-acyltransferase n=1 Tax=Candidatus Liberibacter solanacearum TaxID=556287 RepID=A0A0F4VLF7_9HYPH|nr:acyl-ACP--UDP-N-acetylglucosamine O-acyltransferase [Candidatus Liberibacter solanacearum]KJZ80948.1 UDP-N-acetylglucosamine acyltransferase [Candidatus Liberibacter solanacearum]KJZ82110.1 Acyl-[acyl-carrier-protein]--UDP-N- acetylglucosamine O-acyltransferase [Candidatus Liberibacter solanacearum]KQC49478.1 UDP-N-acetylglucosamine acyltransferase [Candidatus Liberibacter solanacearum]
MSRVSSKSFIHPMALVEEGAVIGPDSVIGPFCRVGPEVEIGSGVELLSHSVITGKTKVGDFTKIFSMAVIGGDTQSIFHGFVGTELVIGKKCVIREGVTINRGTIEHGGKTIIGDNNFILANSHVAHDCILGDGIVISNNVMLAGHVVVEDGVVFGGGSAVHQFVRIGRHAFIGGLSAVSYDVVPYAILNGNPGNLRGINVVGMKRAGLSKNTISRIRSAYKKIFQCSGSIYENAEIVRRENSNCPEVLNIVSFIFAERIRPLSMTKR